jgi:hypothetical protein
MPDQPPWDRIVATAVEHDVKLAYSAHDEAMTWGHDDAYRTCAALRLGLA